MQRNIQTVRVKPLGHSSARPVEARSTTPQLLRERGGDERDETSRPPGDVLQPTRTSFGSVFGRECSRRSQGLQPQVQVRRQATTTSDGKPKGASGSTAAFAPLCSQRTRQRNKALRSTRPQRYNQASAHASSGGSADALDNDGRASVAVTRQELLSRGKLRRVWRHRERWPARRQWMQSFATAPKARRRPPETWRTPWPVAG